MHTQKKQRPGRDAASQATNQDRRVSQQHEAILPASLALARWTRGGDLPHIAATARLPAERAAWYDQLQHDLLAWFAAGGFYAPAAEVDADVAPERVRSVVPK